MSAPLAATLVKVAAARHKHKLAWVAGVLVTAVYVIPFALVVVFASVFGGALTAGSSLTSSGCVTATADSDVAVILATIRTRESGGDYTAKAKGSSASGAYQFTNATWGGYGGYPAAWQAPPEVQDAKATEHVTGILAAHNNDVGAVPVVWYLGHYPRDDEWDVIPAPTAGNTLTPREYQAEWLAEYDRQLAATGDSDPAATPGCAYPIPAGVTALKAREISWGGFQNGRIPLEAMRYSDWSGYMYPPASIAYDAMAEAAKAEGLNIDGWSYRSYEDQADLDAGGANPNAAAPGGSNHGWGLAIDISVLVPGTVSPTHPGYQRAEYLWLKQHAARWGWCHPHWAEPDNSGPHEPWHWEWYAFMGPAGGGTGNVDNPRQSSPVQPVDRPRLRAAA